MGVPAFYRWLSSRYPKCVVLCEEEEPAVVDDVEIPVDYTRPSPNGHVDNLYLVLDMNGIIHPCFHPEDTPAPLTFEECFKAIFAYIDRIMGIVRPRKLLYMAIDGVAPRAKMNQQRSRRFKTAKESKDKMAEEMRIRQELKAQGVKVREGPSNSEASALSDSNIITPGTAFMAKLSIALQYYIHQRINHAPAWKSLAVMLSDANVPGEGEHKIMEYIREQRGRPGWNPNLTHVVSGLDADLIHLALATHESNFHILREVVFGPPAGDDPEGGAKPKIPYQYLKISILREYLALEFSDVGVPFGFDKERIFDDFVFLCFFVGNDFLPHSPTLEIREGGIDLLMTIYKRQLPFLNGWLCDGARVDLKRVEVIVREVARCEERILQKRMRIMKNQESKRNSAVKRPLRVAVPSPPPVPVSRRFGNESSSYLKGTPKKQKTEDDDTTPESVSSGMKIDAPDVSVDSKKVWNELMSVSPEQKAQHILPIASEEESDPAEETNEAEQMVKQRLEISTKEKADMFDSMVEHGESVGFGTAGWKERYYRMKFPNVVDVERRALVKDMVKKFVEGLLWVMAYYYEGVASWTWYYPYHYAPFASDLVNIAQIEPRFQLGEPFLPVNQLMAVLPAASRFCLPECLQHLFVEIDSPIIDFYPEDFKCDMNGKRFSWQAVVLLPFIDEQRLIETTKQYFSEFTDEEKERNVRKLTQFYIGQRHPLTPLIQDAVSDGDCLRACKLELHPETSDGMSGCLCITKSCHPETITAPFNLGDDIHHNAVHMASFLNPPHQRHQCRLLSGAEEQLSGLTPYDIPPEAQIWHEHPRASNNPMPMPSGPQPRFAIDRDAARRFVEHQVSQPRFREEAPARRPIKSTLRASAPEFIPEHVTRMAMQMTRGMQQSVRPPDVPPADVTHAAIRLSERFRQSQDFARPMRPQMQQGFFHPQQPGHAFPYNPFARGQYGTGMQPQIRGHLPSDAFLTGPQSHHRTGRILQSPRESPRRPDHDSKQHRKRKNQP